MVMFLLIFMLLFSNEIDLILGFIIVLVLRELGHFLMMKRYKYTNIRLLFIPLMGAFVHGKKEHYSQKESLMIVAMGLFPGIVVGFALTFFSQNINSVLLFQTGMMFFWLNIVNLVPLDPLDGGQLFKLFMRKNSEKWLLYLTLFFSVFIILIGFYFSSYVMTLFGFLMGFRVRSLQKTYLLHQELHRESISFHVKYADISDRNFWRIKDVIVEHQPALKYYLQQTDDPHSDSLLASQVNAVLVTPITKDASPLLCLFIVLFWIVSSVTPLLLWWLVDLNWVHYAVKHIQVFV